jgi:hypothetical protein
MSTSLSAATPLPLSLRLVARSRRFFHWLTSLLPGMSVRTTNQANDPPINNASSVDPVAMVNELRSGI